MSNLLSSEHIVPLHKGHDRDAFDCGNASLNAYLKRQARQDAEKHVAAPFVLTEPGEMVVKAFFTLSSSIIAASELPPDTMKKLPRYAQLPVTLLGRLAVDLTVKGRGIGQFLLAHALKRCLESSQQIAALAVVVDAKDAQAEAFYRHFDFLPYQSTPTRLYVSMAHLAKLFS